MYGELVKVRTADNVHLHGLFVRSDKQPQINLDAALVIHGLGGNFYGSRLNQNLGKPLLDLGVDVVHINTRGHDSVNLTTRDGKSVNLGAAYEIVDECRHDLTAWVEFLVSRGKENIAYVGHSLGAIKSIYTQANQPHARIQCIIAASASRLSYDTFLSLPTRAQFERCFGHAKELVEQGRGGQLIEVDFPFPTHITAQAYFDKYGPDDKYNWLLYAHKIAVPTLLVFGETELEENSAFVGILNDIEKLELPVGQFDIQTIPGANHFYAGRQSELCAKMEDWLCRNQRLES